MAGGHGGMPLEEDEDWLRVAGRLHALAALHALLGALVPRSAHSQASCQQSQLLPNTPRRPARRLHS